MSASLPTGAGVLLLLVVLLPLLVAVLPLRGAARRFAGAVAALPALVLAVSALAFGVRLEGSVPALLVGASFALDELGAIFLLLTASLWSAAAIYSAGWFAHALRERRFTTFFLLAMSGNLGLCLSADVVVFYLFFAQMGFATWGLVTHDETPPSLSAGRLYLAMVVLGDVLLLAAVTGAVAAVGAQDFAHISRRLGGLPGGEAVIVLSLLGLGVKAGLPLLHVWLPPAHSLAPVPASCVLSGAMLKAGVLGWMRTWPASTPLPDLGSSVMILGLVGAAGGIVLALLQDKPKAVLAYSSVSQMGLLTLASGLFLQGGGREALAAVAIHALHHAFTKGALFLSVGLMQRAHSMQAVRLVWVGIAVLALSLGGLPLSSGGLAKLALKYAAAGTYASLVPVLSLLAVGTVLVMGRFAFLLPSPRPTSASAGGPMWSAWAGLVLAGTPLAWWIASLLSPGLVASALAPAGVATDGWPVAAGLLLVVVAWRLARHRAFSLPHVPPGDVAVVLTGAWPAASRRLVRLGGAVRALSAGAGSVLGRRWRRFIRGPWPGIERTLRRWPVLGTVFMLLTAVLFLLLLD